MIKDEKFIRDNIEECIDNYHKSHELFKEPLLTVILNLLRVFEDSCRLDPGVMIASASGIPQLLDLNIHSKLDAIDMAIKWAYQCCDKNNQAIDTGNIKNYYLKCADVIQLAGKYRGLCDAFTYYSRKRFIAAYDENNKHLSFLYPEDTPELKSEFIDFIERANDKASYTSQSSFEENARNLASIRDKLIKSITVKNKSEVVYSIDEDVWNAFYKVSLMQIDNTKELPDDWGFTYFTMKEYRQVWAILHTMAQIHRAACVLSGAEGVGVDSVIMIKTIDELVAYVSHRSGLNIDKVKKVINYLIYEEQIKNNDIVWQPLIRLNSDSVALSPSLIMLSNSERNIICLINKKEQAAYSRLSNKKEDLMVEEVLSYLTNSYSGLKYKTKVTLPSPLPDIDFLCYDEKTKTMLLCEMKFLLSTDSIQEVCNRDEDLLKGTRQAIDVLHYVKENFGNIIKKCFDITVDKADTGLVFSCVVSKNNIGTSCIDREVPIVSQNRLYELFRAHEGLLVEIIDKLKDYKYFEDIDTSLFQIKYHTVSYAGYKFSCPSIMIKEPPINQKIGRNDPCPCGKINLHSGKVYKYKKCCGKDRD